MTDGADPRVRLAVGLSHLQHLGGHRGESLLQLAAAAETAGADQLVVSEHLALTPDMHGYPGTGSADGATRAFVYSASESWPEPLAALAAMAGVTSTTRLSTNILIAPLRSPVLLAKMAATVDILSQGRLDLGVGAGWHSGEFESVGVPLSRRGHRMDDTVRACQELWRNSPAHFTSPTVTFAELYCHPMPWSPDGIPIFFGGSPSEQTAIRVATMGSGWTPIGGTTAAAVSHGLDLIEKECQRIERGVDEIAVRCTLPLRPDGPGRCDIEYTLKYAAEFVAAGATILQLPPLAQYAADIADVVPIVQAAVREVHNL